MTNKEIVVALGREGLGVALGNVWRITVKTTDFYIEPLGWSDAFHLSVHGPRGSHPDGHRFHLKVDKRAAAVVKGRGDFIDYSIEKRGRAFDGHALGPRRFSRCADPVAMGPSKATFPAGRHLYRQDTRPYGQPVRVQPKKGAQA